MKRSNYLQICRYYQALSSGSMSRILTELEKGADVNQKNIYSAMEVFIARGYHKGIKAVLGNPQFNPNTKNADGLYLIERAMLKSEPLALRIMAHPRFNINQRVSQGRTLAMSAVMFSMPDVFKAAKAHTKVTDRDENGQTLAQYLEQYGEPRRGRLIQIRKQILEEQKMLMVRQAEEHTYS